MEVPDEFAYDEEVQEVQAAVKELQREFVSVHSEVMQFRRSDLDPAKARKHMQELEDEREQLLVKIERMRTKVESVPEVSGLMEAAQKLRRQQEEEMNLASSLRQQREQLEVAEARYERCTAKLRELSASGSGVQPGVLVQNLAAEVANNRRVCEQLNREVGRHSKHLAAVQEVLGRPTPTDADLAELTKTRDKVNAEINGMLERRAGERGGGSSQDLALRQQQQMAQLAARKREEIEAKLERLQEKRLGIQEEQESLMAAALPSGAGPDDWKEKYDNVKSKMGTYKRLKAELDVLQAEALVLTRTEEVLTAHAKQVGADLQKAEAELGVEGAHDVAEDLERVTAAKSQVDEAKGKTLEEISSVVANIQATIKEKKAALAPRIKELRTTRQEAAELTDRHAQLRKRYDAEAAAYHAQNAALQQEVAVMRKSAMQAEAAYHQVSCESVLVDAQIRRVTDHSAASRARDAVLTRAVDSEEKLKTAKTRQRELKDRIGGQSVGQLDVLKDLKELLTVKLEAAKQGNVGFMMGAAQGGAGGIGRTEGASNVLSL